MAGFLDPEPCGTFRTRWKPFWIWLVTRNSRSPEVIDGILASKDYLGRWMGELETMLQTGRIPEMGL